MLTSSTEHSWSSRRRNNPVSGQGLVPIDTDVPNPPWQHSSERETTTPQLLFFRELLADRLQFQPTLLGGLRICHLEILERIEDNAGHNQPGVFLIIGGNGVPGRMVGAC